jgi:phosphatidate cytidylyltransferase
MAEIKKPWNGLSRRIITAIVVATIVISAEYLGGLYFISFILLAAMQMNLELYRMTKDLKIKWRFFGAMYIAAPCIALIWMRDIALPLDPNAGMYIVFFLMALVAATDIGAFFIGRIIGGAKLAPHISPNKTWAGLIGGIGFSCIAALLYAPYLPVPVQPLALTITGIIIAIIAQAGDLFESWMKRRAGVKDSGNLLPGHGGLLDRIDGFMFTAPLLALIIFCSGLAS